jgi:protein SCO1
MTRRQQIITLYASVAVVSVALVSFFIHLGNSVPDQPQPASVAVDEGKEKAATFFPIQKDLSGINQDGKPVKLSELKGKVWVVCEFFAICPHCAVRNGQELKAISDAFKDDPNFHLVCVSVDPKMDTVERLKEYAGVLSADSSRWWFMSAGDEKATHDYMEQELKFFAIRERRDPDDIASNGRFAHDLGLTLVDSDWNVVGKWPLADARQDDAIRRDPHLYERLKAELYERIRQELRKNKTSAP